MSDIQFAAIGINHAHIYGQVDCLIRAGATFVAFHAVEDDLAKTFGEKYPQARRAADQREILEDPAIAVVVTAAIPGDRAAIAIAAMQTAEWREKVGVEVPAGEEPLVFPSFEGFVEALPELRPALASAAE